MLKRYYRKGELSDVASMASEMTLGVRLLIAAVMLGLIPFGLLYAGTHKLIFSFTVSGILTGLSWCSAISFHRTRHRRLQQVGQLDAVEVLEIQAPRVVEIDAPGSSGPALCFELPEGKILMLYGQWLLNEVLYRGPPVVDDGYDGRMNKQDDPFGFPSTHFSLHRWRDENEPFWIEVKGAYLKPEERNVSIEKTRALSLEIFDGNFAILQNAIDSNLPQIGARKADSL